MTRCDVLVAGAGPAGAMAALALARAGARVRLVDRAQFPRPKLCGDTINPGTLAILRKAGVAEELERLGLPVAGMRVTGPGGVAVEGRYPQGLHGLAIERRELDDLLLRAAAAAGASFEPGLVVRAPIVDERDGFPFVEGIEADTPAGRERWHAPVTVAADGRRSTLAFALKLTRHSKPKRWAIGAYVDAPAPAGPLLGEMHVRPGRYIGVVPLPGGWTNICLVMPGGKPDVAGECDFGNPAGLFAHEIAGEPLLRDRFSQRPLLGGPVVLGPLAVEPTGRFVDGLLLAGDAAGFIDPMTGDGLRFAVRGGELAAAAALDALEHGWMGVHARYARACRREFAAKRRFNRVVRSLVSSSGGIRAAAAAAKVVPGVLASLVRYAGDCAHA